MSESSCTEVTHPGTLHAGGRSERTNVAFLIDTITTDTEGTQKQLLELIRRLPAHGVDPVLIVLRTSPWLDENPPPCTLEILGYRGLLKPDIFGCVRRLRRVVQARRIHILQTFFEDSIFVAWLAFALSRRPVLMSSRRDIGLGTTARPWYHAVFKRLLPVVNRRFAAVLANSQEVRAHVIRQERISADRVRVVYNGVELPPEVGPGQARTRVARTALEAVVVGSLTRVKRHDVVLEALAELTRRGVATPKVKFLGDGPLRGELEAQARELGVADFVHFQGAVADVRAHLACADVGVLCSDREGLSNAILEYLASGLPIIATRVGGNPEIIDEGSGILIPPGDPSALADAFIRVASWDRDSVMRHSRRRAVERFSWGASLTQLLECYHDGPSGLGGRDARGRGVNPEQLR